MVTYFARQFAKDAVRWPWIEERHVSCSQRQNVASEINCKSSCCFCFLITNQTPYHDFLTTCQTEIKGIM